MFSKNKKILVTIFLFGIIGGGLAAFFSEKLIYKKAILSMDNSKIDVKSSSTEWRIWIKELGPDGAYNKFKKVYETKFGNHNAIHLFAGLLYEATGLKGIILCDNSFNFGCYHGFFIAAVAQQGESVVKKLDKICLEEFGPNEPGCQHGIGHGVLEYFGHKKLDKALAACALLEWNKRIFGCSSGVFMEYNIPISADKKKGFQSVRRFDPENPLTPCNSVSMFQESCYFELGQYFINVYNKDYEKMGEACSSVVNLNLRKYCFFGLGYYAKTLNRDVNKPVENCTQIQDLTGAITCKAGASVCDSLTGDDLETCKNITISSLL